MRSPLSRFLARSRARMGSETALGGAPAPRSFVQVDAPIVRPAAAAGALLSKSPSLASGLVSLAIALTSSPAMGVIAPSGALVALSLAATGATALSTPALAATAQRPGPAAGGESEDPHPKGRSIAPEALKADAAQTPAAIEAGKEEPSHARARAIVAEALKVGTAWQRLRPLTDTIGARLAGSVAEAKAVAWAKSELAKDGVSARTEPVQVPVWIRGQESGQIVAPAPHPLALLGLGGSVGTPVEGIVASVLVVGSYDELTALGREAVEGKIVLYDNPFPRTGDELKDYREAVRFRSGGASAAAKLGAVAALIRSVATASLRSPHTGALRYADDAPRIPAAALAVEDAMLIRRLIESGHEVQVRLSMGARIEPDREGANVVGEIKGRERPEEIVLIAAHLDSWDVGTGAIDNGAGCVMVIETMRLLASGPPPRRTVRAVLFANEENGGRGSRAYRDAHEGELARHVAAIEADSGAARARGFRLAAGPGGEEALKRLLAPVLAPIGAARIVPGAGGVDTSILKAFGVPLLDLDLDTSRYFDWHHSMADTLDKVEPSELQQATAAMAATAWILAEEEEVLPRLPVETSAKP